MVREVKRYAPVNKFSGLRRNKLALAIHLAIRSKR